MQGTEGRATCSGAPENPFAIGRINPHVSEDVWISIRSQCKSTCRRLSVKLRAVLAAVTFLLPDLIGFSAPGLADTSGPIGQWYLNANGSRLTVTISSPLPSLYIGALINDQGGTEVLDNISWNSSSRLLQFRRIGAGFWEWYYGSVVEGIFVGRFSPSSSSPDEPENLVGYSSHVTGWNSTYLDSALVPRVWELLIDNNARARLRIDQGSNGLVGRLKVYSTVSGGVTGESLEYDLDAIQWDGTNLTFTQHLDSTDSVVYQAQISGRSISGTFAPGSGSFTGARAEVLSHGLVPKTADALSQWINRTRAQLMHLVMADNPQPLSRNVTILGSQLPPIPSVQFDPSRDDNPAVWPQAYTLSELQFDYTLPNPYGGASIARSSHAYLATPNAPPPAGGKYPALLAVNGHDGSGWQMMNPDSSLYWYGDSYARRGYVVLAVDISHRPVGERANLYTDYLEGDDPDHGNGPHPAVKAAGFDSDWEEDGERSWDASRGLDYLLSLPDVDPNRIVLSGMSMGGNVTAITGGLDPRFPIIVAAGYSPDLGVELYNGNHPCWHWQHGDVREYVDSSDYYALVAPRPLLIETGKQDYSYSQHDPPFSADKQVVRRTMAAYQGVEAPFNLYLHYDKHRYHVGDINPTSPTDQGVRVPALLAPAVPWDLTWQTDPTTATIQPTLFAWISPTDDSAPVLSATSLDFGSLSAGTASNPQQVTVTNTADSALVFTSIQTTGDWAIVGPDGCQPSLAIGASCTLSIAFTPTTAGSRTGTLTFADNASNSPQTVSLTGIGLAAIVSLSSTALTFPNLPLGTPSSPQTITLSNTGNQTLSITGVSLSGPNSDDFRVSQNCEGSVAAGASCTIGVTFTPAGNGLRTAVLTVTSNAFNYTQTVALWGISGQAFTLTSLSASAPVMIGVTQATFAIQAQGPSSFTGAISLSCPTGVTCGFSANPILVGQNSTLTLSNLTPNPSSNPYYFTVTGTSGLQSATLELNLKFSDFTLSAVPAAYVIPAGAVATYTINLTPLFGFSNTVALSVVGTAPPLPDSTYSFTNLTPTPNGANPTQVLLTVSTTKQNGLAAPKPFPPRSPGGKLPVSIFGLIWLAGLVSLAWNNKRRGRPGWNRVGWQRVRLATLGLVLALNSGTVACQRNVMLVTQTGTGNYLVIVQGTLSSNKAVSRQVTLDLAVTQ
jgi:acetyl esterase/lipase